MTTEKDHTTKKSGKIQARRDARKARRQLLGKSGGCCAASSSWIMNYTLCIDIDDDFCERDYNNLYLLGYVEGLKRAITKEQLSPTPIISAKFLAILSHSVALLRDR